MSADNSIIILKTPRHKENGFFDYRVIHAMAVENIYWDDKKKCYTAEPNAKYLLEYFDKCQILSEKDAWDEARRMENEVGYVEYGISEIELPKPFEYYRFVVNRKVNVPV